MFVYALLLLVACQGYVIPESKFGESGEVVERSECLIFLERCPGLYIKYIRQGALANLKLTDD